LAELLAWAPPFEVHEDLRRPRSVVATRREPRVVREQRLVGLGLDALGVHTERARRFMSAVLDGCKNPLSRIRRLAAMALSRSFDEVELAWELKQAWRDELDCGERFLTIYERSTHRQTDCPLGWADALRIIDAFDDLPLIDELTGIIEALHLEWLEEWNEYAEHRATRLYERPESFFSNYLVARLQQRSPAIPRTRWGLR